MDRLASILIRMESRRRSRRLLQVSISFPGVMLMRPPKASRRELEEER